MEKTSVVGSEWSIIPANHDRAVELGLPICTGIIMRPYNSPDAPYLVTHSPPIHLSSASIVDRAVEISTYPHLAHYSTCDELISLIDVLDVYAAELDRGGHNPDPHVLAAYACSGFRAVHDSDLAFAYFLEQKGILFGAELNRSSLMQLYPGESQIELRNFPIGSEKVRTNFCFGERYALQLRT